MRSFFRGVADPFRGLRFILTRGRLIRLSILPVLVNLLLYVAIIVCVVLWGNDVYEALWAQLFPEPDSWWEKTLSVAGFVLFLLLAAVALLFSFTAVGAALASPFLSRLSLRVREEIEGRKIEPPGGLKVEILYPLWVNLVRAVVGLGVIVGAFVVQLILPPTVVVLMPLQVAFGGFCLALSVLDFPLETEHPPGFMSAVRFGKTHLGRTLGFGGMLSLVAMVPLLGFLALPAAVAGATLFFCDERKRAADQPA